MTKPCDQQCQSCGMSLDKDPGHGGIEKDGSHSTIYCSLCYKDGAFIGKDCTVTQMQDIVEEAMKKQGFNRFVRKIARRQIPHLGRWKNK